MKEQQRANVLAVVRRLISRGVANKVVGNVIEQNIQHNRTITAADCYPILPAIEPDSPNAQNPTTQIRSTDRIKPKSLIVRGSVGLNYVGGGFSLPDSRPLYVRIMILAQKDIKSSGGVTGSVDTNHLLHAALPTTTPGGITTLNDNVNFDGTLTSLNYPVNKNKFRVYMDKVLYLHSSDISHSFGGDNPGYSKRFKYTFKDLPTNLTFDETNGDNVNNFAPFIAIGWCMADGSSPTLATTLVNANVYSQLVFEDA